MNKLQRNAGGGVRRAGLAAICALALAGPSLAGTPPAGAGRLEVNPAIRPGDDFYAYANDPWIQATPLPAGLGRADTTSALRAENARRVEGLIEDAVKAAGQGPADPTRRKLADYYASRLDRSAVETRGLAPLAAELAAIAAIDGRRGLAAYLGRTVRLDDGTNLQTESLLGLWVHQGFHDPRHYAAHLVQGGLGLPDREDYLSAAQDRAERRALYRDHIATILRAAGFDQTDLRAGRVLELEAAIAATHASRADTDDVFKTDNGWSRADFAARAPGLDWDAYFRASGLDGARGFVVWQPQAVIGAARLVAGQPLEAWKDYLAFRFIEHQAAVSPKAIGEEDRAFQARLSGGAPPPAPDPREEARAATEAVFGDAIGRLYVARYVRPGDRRAAEAMAETLRAAFRPHIEAAAWLSPKAKAEALAKLDALRLGLVYPDAQVDYGPLSVVRGDAFGNLQRADAFLYGREVAKLRRPVDPDEWAGGLYPQTVGAILDISPNSMQFAAGILQPPFFDAPGDMASNYGSAGAGLAHEISHSFDAVGYQYDARGRLAPWQRPEDLARYQAAAAPLAAQLDACCPAPDLCAHGRQVLGESAADLIGLEVAHEAYFSALHGRPDAIRDGLTGEQRFFVAYAQRWRRVQSDAALRRQIDTDSHAPPQCRSHLVRNLDAWARAFDVKPGDRLYLPPEARIRIW